MSKRCTRQNREEARLGLRPLSKKLLRRLEAGQVSQRKGGGNDGTTVLPFVAGGGPEGVDILPLK